MEVVVLQQATCSFWFFFLILSRERQTAHTDIWQHHGWGREARRHAVTAKHFFPPQDASSAPFRRTWEFKPSQSADSNPLNFVYCLLLSAYHSFLLLSFFSSATSSPPPLLNTQNFALSTWDGSTEIPFLIYLPFPSLHHRIPPLPPTPDPDPLLFGVFWSDKHFPQQLSSRFISCFFFLVPTHFGGSSLTAACLQNPKFLLQSCAAKGL